MNVWVTRVSLKTENGQIETDFIEFLSGILQGDQLSLILFILSANPLSFPLSKSDGYMMGSPNKRTTKLTYLFFVDDLKMYSENVNQAKQQLDIVRLQLHGMIYRPDSFVLMLRYCANLKAISYESTTLNRIVADKSHRVTVA